MATSAGIFNEMERQEIQIVQRKCHPHSNYSSRRKPGEAVEANTFVRGIKGLNIYRKRKAFRFIILDSDADFGKHIQTLSRLKHISSYSRSGYYLL